MKHSLLRRLALLLIVAMFWLLYSALHEMGHILALKSFGAWQRGSATLLPLPGQMPHVSADPAAPLAPWQIAVVAISGGLLPTLLGYVVFAAWASPPGSRFRSQRLWADIGWSLLAVMLLFPQAALVPMLLVNAVKDRDYSVFMQNIGRWSSLANTALTMLTLINLAIVGCVVKHFFRLRRIRTANPQGGANGRQPFNSESNPSSAAAASRRSP
jgi:hypothetical protein